MNTVGLDEAKVRKYIKDQDANEMVDDRWNSSPDALFCALFCKSY